MTEFTAEDFMELAESLRTNSREHNARLIDKQLALILVALDHMVEPIVTIDVWQPIETAPLDGTFILCKRQVGKWVHMIAVCSWRKHRIGDDVLADPEQRWRSMESGKPFSPTHWMPIPE